MGLIFDHLGAGALINKRCNAYTWLITDMEKLRVYLIWQSVSNWVILIYYVAHFLCAHITFTAVQLIAWLLHSCVGILLSSP